MRSQCQICFKVYLQFVIAQISFFLLSYTNQNNISMKQLFRISLIACFVVLTFIQVQAQVSFGPKAGLNFSTMTLKTSGLAIDPSNLTGFQAGIIAEISLGNNFALQPGLLYSTKGSSYKISSLGLDFKINPSYLEIPLNAVYKIGAGPVNILLLAGPYFGYGIGGSYKATSGSVTIDEPIKYGSGVDNDLKPFDLGLNFGGGLELSHFQLAFQYCLGMTNLAPVTDNDAEQKNKVMTISVAYLFGVK